MFDKLFILDASPDPEGQDVAGSFDLSGLIERINYAIRKYKARRVAIDSITAVFQQYDARFDENTFNRRRHIKEALGQFI